jgi:hypothetical protein
MAVFGRINYGVHFPGFDDLRSGTPQTQTIHNYEVGYRAQTATIYGVVDLFRRQFNGVPFDQFTGTGAQDIGVYGASSYGLNLEGQWRPIEPVSVDFSGNWQHSIYTGYTSEFPPMAGPTTATSCSASRACNSASCRRTLCPWTSASCAFSPLTRTSDLRYSDIANQQILPAYYTLDAGIVAEWATTSKSACREPTSPTRSA